MAGGVLASLVSFLYDGERVFDRSYNYFLSTIVSEPNLLFPSFLTEYLVRESLRSVELVCSNLNPYFKF